MYPDNLKYTPTHEWVKVEGEMATVGVTEYAIEELGDVVYIELPAPGTKVCKGEVFGSIESVKTVSELIAPVSGVVLTANDTLNDAPEILTEDAYEKGWMVTLRTTASEELADLATAAEYADLLKEQ